MASFPSNGNTRAGCRRRYNQTEMSLVQTHTFKRLDSILQPQNCKFRDSYFDNHAYLSTKFSQCPLYTELCAMENDIDYHGNDDTMPNGKLKCSSSWSGCTESSPVPDVPSCKSFCNSSSYFTWTANKECYCKHSDSGRKQQGGSVSGRTNCPGKI